MPYLDTPNNGGVYKAWATLEEDYLEGCALQGIANGLDVVDCGPPSRRDGGVAHGFMPWESKTDNFKVRLGAPRELDVIFVDSRTGQPIDGLATIWYDTLGASNTKWSVYDPAILAFHEAHVENVETGNHRFDLFDQPGCTIGEVYVDGEYVGSGAQTVDVLAKPSFKSGTIWVHAYCE
jgi:hypothetical protein